MKILFTITKEYWDTYLIKFSKNFLGFLNGKHLTGLLTNADLDLPQIDRYQIENINFSDWDLVIVQDLMSLQWIAKEVEKNLTPVIFLSHCESWKAQPFLCKSLIKVFYSYFGRNTSLPKEIVQHMDKAILSHGHFSKVFQEYILRSSSSHFRAIHFHQPSDYDLAIAKSIIAFANANLDMHLEIIAPKQVNIPLQALCNRNVILIDGQLWDENSLYEYDLAITSDYYALKSLFDGVPTILVGSKGFGGLVTSDKLPDHFQWHFSGRIGGEIGEPAPYWILHDEFELFKKDLPNVLEDTRKISSLIRNRFNQDTVFSFLENKISETVNLNKKIFSEEYLSLKPVIAKEIKIEETRKNTYIIFKGNNKIVGLISNEENKIFQQLNGENPIDQIATTSGIPVTDIADFIKELWYQKIITFAND